MIRQRRVVLAAAVVLAAGCSSGTGLKSYPFNGQWDGSGALAGYVVVATESGQTVSGQMSGPADYTSSIAGSVAGGTVSFDYEIPVTYQFGENPGNVLQFTGHFRDANTLVGTTFVNGQSQDITWTRVGS